MPTPIQSSQDDISSPGELAAMSRFVEAHGADAREADPGESRKGAPVQPDRGADASGDSAGDEAHDLDDSTLKALGLLEDEERKPNASGEDDGTGGVPADLSQVATSLGLDVSDLLLKDGRIRVKTKVDGEPGEVSLDELRKGYQLQSHFTRQQEQFLREKQQWDDTRKKAETEFIEQSGMAMKVLQAQEESLNREFSVDWAALRQEDPAEYAAKMAEYQQRLNGIRGTQQRLYTEAQKHVQEHQQQQQQKLMEHMQREAGVLAERMGWTDPAVWKTSMERVAEYLRKDIGFDDRAINSLVDHRAYVVAEKARKYDDLMRKIETTKKRVKEDVPIVPASGAAAPSGSSGKRKVERAQDRLKQTGSLADAAAVFQNLGI